MKKGISKIPFAIALCGLIVGGGLLVHYNNESIKEARAALPQEGDLYGAAKVNFLKTLGEDDDDMLVSLRIDAGTSGGGNYSGAGLYMRMKNYTGTNTYINMKMVAGSGAMQGPKRGVQHTYYNLSGNEVTYSDIVLRDYSNYLILPANFDGYVYMNYETQMAATDDSPAGKTFRYSAVKVLFEISAKYDSYATFAIGDLFTDTRTVLDTSEIAVEAFPTKFVNLNSDYLNIVQQPRSDDYEPRGDLLGSVNVASSGYAGFRILADGKSAGTAGIYTRIKNNNNSEVKMLTHMNSRNNARVTAKAGENYYLFNSQGLNKTEYTFGTDKMLTIPASFDGFLYLPVASYEANTDWSSEVFDKSDLFAVYFEGVFGSVDFGDTFSQEAVLYDGSEIYPSDLNLYFVMDWGCILTLNEGHAIPPVVEFPYEQVNYISSLEEGVQVTCNRDREHDTIATLDIVLPQVSDFSDALAITVRMKGVAGDFPFFFRIIDNSDNISHLPSKASGNKVKYVNNGQVVNASTGGNDHSFKYLMGLDGELIIPVDVLESMTATGADLAHVKAFQIGIAVFYDYDFNAVFGDIGYVVEATQSQTIVLNCRQATFENVYIKRDGSQFINIKKYYSPSTCPWIGDVKLLNPLHYESNAEMLKEVVWNEGDNACSYEVMNDGIFVHIGPFEAGHQYGNYMCLQMDEKGVYTDRKIWSREVGGEKQLAKGITAYVKNLSRKDIGITLQIDEQTGVYDERGNEGLERWCITGYPAMYYAWDVNTGAEYTFYCKSDQFQIPVGFEGYVRIPFESYRVPDWCQSTVGVDNVLNIEKWSGKFYLTSDNTRFEDLEFFIKNVGVYFNETRRGNLFDNSHTIKANMGL